MRGTANATPKNGGCNYVLLVVLTVNPVDTKATKYATKLGAGANFICRLRRQPLIKEATRLSRVRPSQSAPFKPRSLTVQVFYLFLLPLNLQLNFAQIGFQIFDFVRIGWRST